MNIQVQNPNRSAVGRSSHYMPLKRFDTQLKRELSKKLHEEHAAADVTVRICFMKTCPCTEAAVGFAGTNRVVDSFHDFSVVFANCLDTLALWRCFEPKLLVNIGVISLFCVELPRIRAAAASLFETRSYALHREVELLQPARS